MAPFLVSTGNRITWADFAGSHLSCTVVSTGSKRSWTASGDLMDSLGRKQKLVDYRSLYPVLSVSTMFAHIAFMGCYSLPIKKPSKIAVDDTLLFLPFSLEENKA